MLVQPNNAHSLILIPLVDMLPARDLGQERGAFPQENDGIRLGKPERADESEDRREDGEEGGDPAPAGCFAQEASTLR